MRRLRCIRCGTVWPVFEEPVEFIDPDRYVCPDCLRPVPGQQTLDLPEPVTVRYDPQMSAFPEGF